MYLAVYLHEPVYLGRALEVYTLYGALPRGRHRPLYVLSYSAALPVYIYCAVSTRIGRHIGQDENPCRLWVCEPLVLHVMYVVRVTAWQVRLVL